MKILPVVCASLFTLVVATHAFAIPYLKGKIFRQKEDGLEIVISSKISPGSARKPLLSSEMGFVVEPGDVISYRIYLQNASLKIVHLITSPEFGFKDFGGDFRYSCDPQYFDGSFVRIATPRLCIVDLKPGEMTFLGEVQYSCQQTEIGENSFMYSISKVMAEEYGVWSGSILCHAPFFFKATSKNGEPSKK